MFRHKNYIIPPDNVNTLSEIRVYNVLKQGNLPVVTSTRSLAKKANLSLQATHDGIKSLEEKGIILRATTKKGTVIWLTEGGANMDITTMTSEERVTLAKNIIKETKVIKSTFYKPKTEKNQNTQLKHFAIYDSKEKYSKENYSKEMESKEKDSKEKATKLNQILKELLQKKSKSIKLILLRAYNIALKYKESNNIALKRSIKIEKPDIFEALPEDIKLFINYFETIFEIPIRPIWLPTLMRLWRAHQPYQILLAATTVFLDPKRSDAFKKSGIRYIRTMLQNGAFGYRFQDPYVYDESFAKAYDMVHEQIEELEAIRENEFGFIKTLFKAVSSAFSKTKEKKQIVVTTGENVTTTNDNAVKVSEPVKSENPVVNPIPTNPPKIEKPVVTSSSVQQPEKQMAEYMKPAVNKNKTNIGNTENMTPEQIKQLEERVRLVKQQLYGDPNKKLDPEGEEYLREHAKYLLQKEWNKMNDAEKLNRMKETGVQRGGGMFKIGDILSNLGFSPNNG